MLWACLAHEDVDVALASSDSISALLQTLRRQLQAEKEAGESAGGKKSAMGEAGTFRAMDHLPQLLATLYQRMK